MKKIFLSVLLCCIIFGMTAGCAEMPDVPETFAESSETDIPSVSTDFVQTPEIEWDCVQSAPEPPGTASEIEGEQLPTEQEDTASSGTDVPDETEAVTTPTSKTTNTAAAETGKSEQADPKTSLTEEITLYAIDLNGFYRFLDSSDEATLKKVADHICTFPGAQGIDGNRFPLWGSVFEIDSDALLKFTENDNLQRFLKEHGITVSVKSRSIVYEYEIGWFVFVRGDHENAYIAFEEEYTEVYPYLKYKAVCYREAEFREKHKAKPCRLVVDGKDISDICTVRLNEKSIDLPLLAIFKALDYEITWVTETQTVISKDGKTFDFDKRTCRLFYSVDGTKYDVLLAEPGGMKRWTDVDGDVLINDGILRSLIQILDRELSCDRDTGIITIAKS